MFDSHWLREQSLKMKDMGHEKYSAWSIAMGRKWQIEDMLKRKDLKPEYRAQLELKLKHDLEIIRDHENDLAIQEIALQLYCKQRQLPAPKPQFHRLKL
jgi:hypothetical protein